VHGEREHRTDGDEQQADSDTHVTFLSVVRRCAGRSRRSREARGRE
jgi:hypothetical protein